MAENTFMAFRCTNAECGKLLKLRRPKKSGIYPVTCPHCGTKKHLRLKGLDAFPEATSEATPLATASNPQATATPQAKQPVELQGDFVTGATYKPTCPHCHEHELTISAIAAGTLTIECERCKGKVAVQVRRNTQILQNTEMVQVFKGRLVQLRRGWINKRHQLVPGKNTIGRYDAEMWCNIAIRNDSSMSRRSVEIDVSHTERGYAFKLTVLNATNPVMHNNQPLRKGESVSLNFGDTILMGKTRFIFEREK